MDKHSMLRTKPVEDVLAQMEDPVVADDDGSAGSRRGDQEPQQQRLRRRLGPVDLMGFGIGIVIAVLVGHWASGPVIAGLIVVAWFTVALGLFLAYALFFIIRIPCPLCLTGHAINWTLAVILTFILR